MIPLPSKRGIPTSARRPLPDANGRARQLRRRESGRVRRPHRVHTENVLCPSQQRQGASVHRRRKAVERPRVKTKSGTSWIPSRDQPRGDLLLRGQRPGRPLTDRRLRRRAAGLGHPVGERRVLEHDDHPLADRDRARGRCRRSRAMPAAPSSGGDRRLSALAAARGERARSRSRAPAARLRRSGARCIRVEVKVVEDREARLPYRPADAIIAALSVQSASGAKRAPGSDARSSELAATPPTTAICSCPSRSAAARVRSTSARTIARWYDAARSALRASDLAAEIAHGVEQRRLDAGEREVEPVERARPGTRRRRDRPPARAGRSRAPPG